MTQEKTLYAQKMNKIYFDQNWDTCSSKKHHFFRVESASKELNLIKVSDYYKSGAIQMIGLRNPNYDIIFLEGEVIHYHENGQIQSISNYFNNKLNGTYTHFDSTGIITRKTFYLNDVLNGYDSTFNKDHKPYVVSNYKQGKLHGDYLQFFENGQIEVEKFFHNSLLHKDQLYYYESGEIRRREIYELGKMVEGKCFDINNIEIDYYPRQENAKFNGNFGEFLSKNMKYPKKASRNNITGRVNVQFVVDIDGNLKDIKILRSINPALDAEAIRVIQLSSGLWESGTIEKEKQRMVYVQPITFRLD